jgi:hypothetical protein
VSEPTNPSSESRWNVSPTQKAKNAVQRSVTALLDELAPERVVRRVEEIPGPIEQHRRPNGCVLQAAKAAVSVTWFPDVGVDAVFGELQVNVWHGSVTRRGAGPVRNPATTVSEMVLRPIEPPEDGCEWVSSDGTRYSTASLAAKCIALLQQQIAARA